MCRKYRQNFDWQFVQKNPHNIEWLSNASSEVEDRNVSGQYNAQKIGLTMVSV